MVAMVSKALRTINPAIPKEEDRKQVLVTDRTRMRCEGLLTRMWLLKNEGMVTDLLEGRGSQWDQTNRSSSNMWMTKMWGEVYEFNQQKLGWAARLDKYI